MGNRLSVRQSKLLLCSVIIARSTSFMFSKIVLADMTPFNLLAMRFLIAFALLAVIFAKKIVTIKFQTLRRGLVLGLVFSGVMICEMYSLKSTSTSITSFLENSAVVIVPILNLVVFRIKPKRKFLLGCIPTILGVAILTLYNSKVNVGYGIIFSLAAALLYSTAILLTDRFSKEDDPLLLGIVQVGCIGVVCLLVALLSGNLSFATTPKNYVYIIILAIVCSGFGFTLQPMAQQNVDSSTAGMYCALNPLSCTVLGIIFLHESCSVLSVIGCCLIIVGIVIPHIGANNPKHHE